MKLSVIIPVYNEQHTLLEIINQVCAVDIPKEIIVVDDYSTDGTRDLYPQIEDKVDKIVLQPRNMGKGGAIREGLRHVTGDFVVVQDADLEYDPQEYHVLLEPLLSDKADVVFGSRFLGGRPHRVLYFWHMIGNQMLTLLSNMTTNLNLTDMETCFKMFRADVIRDIKIEQNRFGFEPEITAKVAKKRNVRFYEVGISYSGRTYNEGKKINWKDGISAVKCILKYGLSSGASKPAANGIHNLWDFPEYAAWAWSEIQNYVDGAVLELGSGSSGLASHLVQQDHVVLTDPQKEALEPVEEKYGQRENVEFATLDLDKDLPPDVADRQFDTICCYNTLDRVREDGEALRTLHDLLAPGGRLILLEPAHASLMSSLDRALGRQRRYNSAELVAKLAANSYRIERFTRFNPLGAIGWFLSGKLMQFQSVGSSQASLARFFLPVAKFVNNWQFVKFGISHIVVARKIGE